MARPVFTANLDTLITGIMPGVNADHVPLWVEAADVSMEAGGIRPMPGYTTPYADDGYFDSQAGQFDTYAGLFDDAGTRTYLTVLTGDAVKGIHVQKQSNGRLLVVWGSDTALYTWDGTTVVDATRVTPYSGTEIASDIVDTTQWSFAQWGDWVLATNGADTPQVLKYGSATEFEDIANFPVSTAQVVRVLGPHALFFNLSGTYTPAATDAEQNQVVWCGEDDIESWDPGTDPTAGELVIREHPGPILAAEHLGENINLYGESSVSILQYGGQLLFTAQRGLQGIRALSKNSIASISSRHIVLTQNGLFATDGLSFQPIAYPALGGWLENNVDWTQRSRISHQVDIRRAQVKWTLPLIDGGLYVLVYNWLTDKITQDLRAFSAGTRVESLGRPLMGMFNGEVKMLIDGPTDRQPLLVTKPMLIADRTNHVYLDALVARWSGDEATVEIRYGESHDETVNAAWESLGTLSLLENILWCNRETMFAQIRIRSADVSWLFSGFEFVGNAGGGRF